MAAPREPVDYGFNHVLEHPGPLDPRIPFRVVAYSEPARQTRNIRLLGKQRPLVFLRDKPSRDKYFKLGWKDVTRAFHAEWEKGEDGVWRHEEPAPTPAPIRAPDARQDPPPAPPADGLAGAIAILDGEDKLSVKKLAAALATGDYDDHLQAMLKFERGKEDARAGAVAALATRIGNVQPRS